MKKKACFLLVLLIAAELALSVFMGVHTQPAYADIAEAMKLVPDQDEVWREKTIRLQKFSIDGRNYESAVISLKDSEARILSMKTEEEDLVIPAKIGDYPVREVGCDWSELKEAREYVCENEKTPELGKLAWMMDPEKPYRKIVMEEGIVTVYNESFCGVSADELDLPASIRLLGSISFMDSQIGEIKWAGDPPVTYWGAFLNTEHKGLFKALSPKNVGQIVDDPLLRDTYKKW